MLTAAAEGGLCILVHPGQWEPGLPGEPDGVSVLGGGDEVFTVDASHLYPALTIGKVDRERLGSLLMREAGTLGVRHHTVGRTVAGQGQGASLVSAAATLHHDGFEPG